MGHAEKRGDSWKGDGWSNYVNCVDMGMMALFFCFSVTWVASGRMANRDSERGRKSP